MGMNDTGVGEPDVGDGIANLIAAAKNPVHIPQSAYAHLASILIENPRAQAALGIFRDSDWESGISAPERIQYRSPQTPDGARSSRPITSCQDEEIILSNSDDEVADDDAFQPHKRKRSDSPHLSSYYGPPHISRQTWYRKRPKTSTPADSSSNTDDDSQHSESFAVNLAQAFWPLSTHVSTDEESWDEKLARDVGRSKKLITGRLVRNPTDASVRLNNAALQGIVISKSLISYFHRML